MTRATFRRRVVTHGLGGYQAGCRCTACVDARQGYDLERKGRARGEATSEREAERAAQDANRPVTLAMEHLYAAGWSPVQVSSLFWLSPAEVRAVAALHGPWADVRQAVELLVEAMALPHERR